MEFARIATTDLKDNSLDVFHSFSEWREGKLRSVEGSVRGDGWYVEVKENVGTPLVKLSDLKR